jgi:hypothetical protein
VFPVGHGKAIALLPRLKSNLSQSLRVDKRIHMNLRTHLLIAILLVCATITFADASFNSTVGYSYRGSRIRLYAYDVENNSDFRSGRLRLRLWATDVPWEESYSGYVLGITLPFRPLNPYSAYSYMSRVSRMHYPPNGYYYVTMTLEEQQRGEDGRLHWYTVDTLEFDGLSYFYHFRLF